MNSAARIIVIIAVLAAAQVSLGADSLSDAAQEENIDALSAITARKGFNINRKNEMGQTILHEIAINGLVKSGKFLLSRGAKVNVADDNGDTPLLVAIDTSHLAFVELLVKHGADVKAKNNQGKTALHAAAEYCMMCGQFSRTTTNWMKKLGIARLLLAKGADINARDIEGKTPLHVASFNGRLDMAKFLLGAGANRNAKDNLEKTPLDMAKMVDPDDAEMNRDRQKVAEFLSSSGKQP